MKKTSHKEISIRIPKSCPACKSEELIILDEFNILCGECEWDNSHELIDSGLFDQLIYEYERMLAEEKMENQKDPNFDRYVDEHYANSDNP